MIPVLLKRSAVGALALLLVGCGSVSEPHPTGQGWAAEFERARAEVKSEFALQVLQNDEISEQEYQESQAKFVQCLADAGLPGATFDENGGSSIPDQGFTAQQVQSARADCDVATGFTVIQTLHLGMRINPSNADPNAVISACLVRRGVVDPGYSVSDYARDMEKFMSEAVDGADPASAVEFTDPVEGPKVFAECQSDPTSGDG